MDNNTITFTIWKLSNNMCRITANSCLSEVRAIADGGCICSFDVMLGEMSRIDREVKERFGAKAAFDFCE